MLTQNKIKSLYYFEGLAFETFELWTEETKKLFLQLVGHFFVNNSKTSDQKSICITSKLRVPIDEI